MLVEDAVVGEEMLAVHALDGAVCADECGIREVAVERRRADQRDGICACARDFDDRLARGADETRPQQQVLGRVARDRELGEDDEVGGCPLRLGDRGDDPLDVPVEVADDDVQLRERDPHRGILALRSHPQGPSSFRLAVTNVTLAT